MSDAGLDFGIADDGVALLVEGAELVEAVTAEGAVHAVWVGEVEDGVAGVAEFDAAVLGGEEAAAPEAIVERLVIGTAAAEGAEDDVGGEVLVFAAETVGRP